MKKIIIIAAVILSAITAFAFANNKTTENKSANTVKITASADLAGKSNSLSGSQLGSAD